MQKLGEPLVQAADAQQVVADPLVEAQRAGAGRGGGQGGRIEREQAVAAQRAVRQEGVAALARVAQAPVEQGERQVRGGVLAGRVVLDVGVQALERRVKLRRQAEEQDVLLERRELEVAGQQVERGRGVRHRREQRLDLPLDRS